jgi:Ohr subfamily peroxiredoxin
VTTLDPDRNGSISSSIAIPLFISGADMSTPQNARKVLYTGKVRTVGDRDGGVSRSDDGRLDLTHTIPGKPGKGTNPEQLLAAGWAACFQGAMGLAAGAMKVALPEKTSIDAEVDLCLGADGYSLQVRFDISVPGVSREVAQALIDAAHQTCPYSKAMRGNVPVTLHLV